jgi:hypothetical protein
VHLQISGTLQSNHDTPIHKLYPSAGLQTVPIQASQQSPVKPSDGCGAISLVWLVEESYFRSKITMLLAMCMRRPWRLYECFSPLILRAPQSKPSIRWVNSQDQVITITVALFCCAVAFFQNEEFH